MEGDGNYNSKQWHIKTNGDIRHFIWAGNMEWSAKPKVASEGYGSHGPGGNQEEQPPNDPYYLSAPLAGCYREKCNGIF